MIDWFISLKYFNQQKVSKLHRHQDRLESCGLPRRHSTCNFSVHTILELPRRLFIIFIFVFPGVCGCLVRCVEEVVAIRTVGKRIYSTFFAWWWTLSCPCIFVFQICTFIIRLTLYKHRINVVNHNRSFDLKTN